MEKEWTEQDLRLLAKSAAAVFEAADLAELDAAQAEEWKDDGLLVDYELRGGQVHCMLRRRVWADGRLWELRMSAPLAGNILPEDRMTPRERELCRDDMNHDFLSGVYNRRYLETVLRGQLRAWAGAGRPAAVALVSLDNAAALLRDHGQPVMDQLICFVANQWKKHFDQPAGRVVCRLTGSVFVVACAGVTRAQLEQEMRALYAAMPRACVYTTGRVLRVGYTLTVACAGLEEAPGGSWESLYALCDERLRAADAAGGDRVYEA